MVRLQFCTLLSRLRRHEQAFAEASYSKAMIDELWDILTEAKEACAMVDATGDYSRSTWEYRGLIRNPPGWLSKLAEVSVLGRQAIATELEFLGHPPVGSLVRLTPGDGLMAESIDPDAETVEVTVTADRLQEEALHVARNLLPEEDPVRKLSEKILVDAADRKTYSPPRALLKRRSTALLEVPLDDLQLPPQRSKPPPLEIPADLPAMYRVGEKQRLWTPSKHNESLESFPSTADTGGLFWWLLERGVPHKREGPDVPDFLGISDSTSRRCEGAQLHQKSDIA